MLQMMQQQLQQQQQFLWLESVRFVFFPEKLSVFFSFKKGGIVDWFLQGRLVLLAVGWLFLNSKSICPKPN